MKYLILVLALGMTACSAPQLVSEKDEFWVIGQSGMFGFYNTEVLYCRAMKEADGRKMRPTCFEADQVSLREIRAYEKLNSSK